MFFLARIQLSSPVTLLIPSGRPRVVSSSPTPVLPGQGVPREFTGFDACFRINPVTRTIHAELPPLPRPLLVYGAADFSAIAADTPEQHAERVLQILGSDPAAVLQAVIDGTDLPPQPPRIPREVANWRAKAILATMGLTASVEAAIDALPEPQKTVVRAAWQGDAKLARRGATVSALGSALGITPAQIDTLFIEAESLSI